MTTAAHLAAENARLQALVEELQSENRRLAFELANAEDADFGDADDIDDDADFGDADDIDDDAYRPGCGLYDSCDSSGRPLKNGGRTCNDAGEPWWM